MTPKALEWQKKIRKFVNDELIPWEVHAEMNNGELPEDIEKKHREIALSLGLAGMGISKDSGGLGLNFLRRMRAGDKHVHIVNIGKRKIRYYKNGKPYVIVKGRKVKI